MVKDKSGAISVRQMFTCAPLPRIFQRMMINQVVLSIEAVRNRDAGVATTGSRPCPRFGVRCAVSADRCAGIPAAAPSPRGKPPPAALKLAAFSLLNHMKRRSVSRDTDLLSVSRDSLKFLRPIASAISAHGPE